MEVMMKKNISILGLSALCFILFASFAFASSTLRFRRMADSEYRIAQKAYRQAVSEYGDNLTDIPATEKMEACSKIRRALYDNKRQYNLEDAFTQPRYKRQIKKLQEYSSELGCPTGSK